MAPRRYITRDLVRPVPATHSLVFVMRRSLDVPSIAWPMRGLALGCMLARSSSITAAGGPVSRGAVAAVSTNALKAL
jgi:hypothetical protein